MTSRLYQQSYNACSQLLVDLLINNHSIQQVLKPMTYRPNHTPLLLDLIISPVDVRSAQVRSGQLSCNLGLFVSQNTPP